MSFKHRMQAWGELFNRYRKTFSYHWQHRNQLKNGMLCEDEAAFLPAALAVQETPPSPAACLIAWILMLMVVIAFSWAIFGKMDIIVNAQDRVIPSAYTKTIASVEIGSVVSLNVREGQGGKSW